MVLVVIGLVVLLAVARAGISGFVSAVSKSVGPVTSQSVQQSLGEVPLYPNAQLDTSATQTALIVVRGIEKGTGERSGAMFKGIAVMETSDSADKVLHYYGQKLKGAGWEPVQTPSKGSEERRAYRKGKETVMIQIQDQNRKTVVTLMRGGPELLKNAPSSTPGTSHGSG